MANTKPIHVDTDSGELRVPRESDDVTAEAPIKTADKTSSELQNTIVEDGQFYYDTDEDRGVLGSVRQYLVGLRDTGKKVNTISDVIGDTPSWYETSFSATPKRDVLGYYEVGDGGGGTFYWDDNEDKANHNGGTIINPDHNSTIGSANWYSATGDSTDTTGSGCWVLNFSGYINLKWFGAKGDGSNDDYNAIQSAFDYLNTLLSGKLLMPDSQYNVSTKITFPSNSGSYSIFGDGVLVFTGSSGSLLEFPVGNYDVKVSDVTIDANNGSSDDIIRRLGGDRLTFKNVSFINSYSTHFRINNTHSEKCTIKFDNCLFEDCGNLDSRAAVIADEADTVGTSVVSFVDTDFINCYRSCVVSNCKHSSILGGRSEISYRGPSLRGSANLDAISENSASIIGHKVYINGTSESYGMVIGYGVLSATVVGNIIEDESGNTLKAIAVDPTLSGGSNVDCNFTVVGNSTIGCDQGIHIIGAKNGVVSGNTIRQPNDNGIRIVNAENVHINNNFIDKEGSDLIVIVSDCNNITRANNIFHNADFSPGSEVFNADISSVSRPKSLWVENKTRDLDGSPGCAYDIIECDTSNADLTMGLPSISSVGTGQTIKFYIRGENEVSIEPSSSDNLYEGGSTISSKIISSVGVVVEILSTHDGWVIL